MQDNPDHNHIEVQINSELVPRWYVNMMANGMFITMGGLNK